MGLPFLELLVRNERRCDDDFLSEEFATKKAAEKFLGPR